MKRFDIRGRVRRWSVHIAIGAILSAASGVLCSRVLWDQRQNGSQLSGAFWRRISGTANEWPARVPKAWPRSPAEVLDDGDGWGYRRVTWRRGVLAWEAHASAKGRAFRSERFAFGFPLPTMRVDWATSDRAFQTTYGDRCEVGFPASGIVVGEESFFYLVRYVVPVMPWWPGFVVSSAGWAVVSLATWKGAGALGRAMRPRPGLCRGCGYPRGTSPVCTECGRLVSEGTISPS